MFRKKIEAEPRDHGYEPRIYLDTVHRDEAANLEERQRLAVKDGGVPFLGELRLDRLQWGSTPEPFPWRVDRAERDPNVMDLRLWASNRGQTLARTVRGVLGSWIMRWGYLKNKAKSRKTKARQPEFCV